MKYSLLYVGVSSSDVNTFTLRIRIPCSTAKFLIRQKGIDLNHDCNVVVGKHCRMRTRFTISLYELTYALFLFICFKLVMKLCLCTFSVRHCLPTTT